MTNSNITQALNLGILAHVDAGKTSLTERLLYHVGVLNHLGKVDSGDTHTDSMELEKQRGITIQSSVVSFHLNNKKINLLDTPGHADFISEVERALQVIDAVILVISAVEGIQPQTRILMNTLKRLQKPTLIFVNKADRKGAHLESILKTIQKQLQIIALPMVQARHIGTADIQVSHLTTKEADYYHQLMESLSIDNESFVEMCLANDLHITKQDFIDQLLQQTSDASFYPLYIGSAVTGVGIEQLLVGIEHYLPYRQVNKEADLAGSVFKIEKQINKPAQCYINLTAGHLNAKQIFDLYRYQNQQQFKLNEKASVINVFQQGELLKTQSAQAGDIVTLTGLQDVHIGDCLSPLDLNDQQTCFSKPTLETTIAAVNPKEQSKLYQILQDYALQDPFISLHRHQETGDLCINLYGEIQQQIIKDRLKLEHSLEVNFSDSKMICVERLVGVGEAVNIMDLPNAPLEYYATIGLKVEPGPIDSGVQYHMESQRGKIPNGYHTVIKEAIFDCLQSGLHGWQITDCIIHLTEAGVCPLSIAPHFRQLTPILLRQALQQAKTQVCQPISQFTLDVPNHLLSPMMVELGKYDAKILDGLALDETYVIKGIIATQHIYHLQSMLPNLTQGAGVLTVEPAGYMPI